jgi:DivIVA domain-containing protein
MTEDPRIDPADLRNVRFPGSSRRYDARAVDQFLETVAARITATNALVDELQARITELEDAAPAPAAPAPPPPKLAHLGGDELVQLVGEETASVLSTARRAAEEIRSKAEEAAARLIREASSEADRVSAEAEERAEELTRRAEEAMEQATTEATAEATRIRDEATAEAEQTRAEASELAEAELAAAVQRRAETDGEVERILEEAREEGRGMVKEAKEVRTRVLEDLQRRRDIARDQIERLLAGRERLLAAYGLVRENLDDITAQLADSLPDPGEPDLPDGFVGIVGSSAQVADDDEPGDVADEASETEPDVEVIPVDAAELDDTVAPSPVSETEAEIASSDDNDDTERGGDLDTDDAVAADEVEPDDAVAEATDVEDQVEDDSEEPAPAEPAARVEEEPDDGPAAEDEPVAEAPTELESDEAEEHAAGAAGDVDELFARLRAEREQSVAKARQVVGAEANPAPEAVTDGAEVEDEVAEEPDADVQPGNETADAAESERESRGDVDRVPAEFLADETALESRTEALTPLEGALNRALKRRLADEQNELLDLLRRSGATTADTLLPELSAQVDGYARLAEEHLRSAAAAGGSAAGGGTDVDVAALAAALGAALVEPFRRRVERSASEVDGDADELDERLRALYREWKVQHIGPVAEDALLSAYALGTLRVAEPDGQVRWLIDPAQGPCPDAQDNALAGAVQAGEAFATGDVCPQAHPGCRCLLVSG